MCVYKKNRWMASFDIVACEFEVTHYDMESIEGGDCIMMIVVVFVATVVRHRQRQQISKTYIGEK